MVIKNPSAKITAKSINWIYMQLKQEVIQGKLLLLRETVNQAAEYQALEILQRGKSSDPTAQEAASGGGYKEILHDLILNKEMDSVTKNSLLRETFLDLAALLKKCADLVKATDITKALKYYTDSAIHLQYALTLLGTADANAKLKIDNQMRDLNKLMIETGSLNKLMIETGSSLPKDELTRVIDEQSEIKLDLLSHKNVLMKLREAAKLMIDLDQLSHENVLMKLREAAKLMIETGSSLPQDELTRVISEQSEIKLDLLSHKAVGQEFFNYVSDSVKTYMSDIAKEAIKRLGNPPCGFSIIGLGSLALRQMTPYSDLEFAILTENEDYKKDPNLKVRQYFKILAHYMRFVVAAHGGTPIHQGIYGIDTTECGNKAISFDTGGHTPLGTIDGTQRDYDLVCTVDQMVQYLDGSHNEKVGKGDPALVSPTLPKAIITTCLIYQHPNSSELHKAYREKAKAYLAKHGKNLGMSILSGESLDSIGGDLEKYRPKGYENEGRRFDAKNEIYRIIDRLIHDVGLIDGVMSTEDTGLSAIDVINKLAILEDTKTSLTFAINYANTLRLRTYDYYRKQQELIDIPSSANETINSGERPMCFSFTGEEVQEGGALFKFYRAIVPFKEALERLCIHNKHGCVSNLEMPRLSAQDDYKIKADVFMRLSMYKKALENAEEWFTGLTTTNASTEAKLAALNTLCEYSHASGDLVKRAKYAKQVVQVVQDLRQQPELKPSALVAIALSNLGAIYRNNRDYDEAIEYHKDALKMRQELYEEPHPHVATSLNNLGLVYIDKGWYNEAIECHKKALKMRRELYKEPHQFIATSLDNLGIVYTKKGEYDEAIKHHKDALKMRQELYGQSHLYIAHSLNNLGSAYEKVAQYQEALKCHEDALKIFEHIYGESHPHVATSLHHLGLAYANNRDYDKAIKHHKDALEMRRELRREGLHPDIANSLDNLGLAHANKGEYDNAIKCYTGAIKYLKKAKNPSDGLYQLANSLCNLGAVYSDQKRYQKAIENLEEGLKAFKVFYKGQAHPDIVTTLKNLVVVYKQKSNYADAVERALESTSMYSKLHLSVPQEITDFLKSRQMKELLEGNKLLTGAKKIIDRTKAYYGATTKLEGAAKSFQKVLSIKSALYGADDPEHTRQFLDMLCENYIALGGNNATSSWADEWRAMLHDSCDPAVLGADLSFVNDIA